MAEIKLITCPYCGNKNLTPTKIRALQRSYRCKDLECDRRFTIVVTQDGWKYHDRTLAGVNIFLSKRVENPDRSRDLGEVLDLRGIGRVVNASELS